MNTDAYQKTRLASQKQLSMYIVSIDKKFSDFSQKVNNYSRTRLKILINFPLIIEIEPEVEIKSTESYHIQKTFDEKDNNNADSSSQNQFGKFRNEYDTTQNEKDTNNDPFRKNKSTVYGTPKNQRRNTKGILCL